LDPSFWLSPDGGIPGVGTVLPAPNRVIPVFSVHSSSAREIVGALGSVRLRLGREAVNAAPDVVSRLISHRRFVTFWAGADPAHKPRKLTQRNATGTKGRRLPDRIAETSSVVLLLLLGMVPHDQDWRTPMPKNGDFKKLVRARMVKTAESYAIARMRLLGEERCDEKGPPCAFSLPAGGTRPLSDGPAIFQVKVALLDIEPAIWRRILVPADTTLDQFHDVIQAAFGWWNYHLHQYLVDGKHYALPDADDDDDLLPPRLDERAVQLRDLLTSSSIVYEYDFGDDWKHLVEIESVAMKRNPGVSYPVCTGGERACPREDCGGTHGYRRLLEALADPMHEEHAELKQWAGRRYDPEKFDPAVANRALRKLRKRPSRSHRDRDARP